MALVSGCVAALAAPVRVAEAPLSAARAPVRVAEATAGAAETPLSSVQSPASAAEASLSTAQAPARAAEAPASVYDRAGVTHDEQCVRPAVARVAVRDVAGTQLQTQAGPVSERGEAREACATAAGVRMEGIEATRAGAMTMYYSWPLEGGGQAAGFVAASELAWAPRVDGAAAAGNGVAAPSAAGQPEYAVTPQDIAFEQRYEGPSTGRWYTYSVYGRPLGGARFALLSWSWVDVRGGGIARAAVAEGQRFYPADVQPITLTSAPGAGRPGNGTVTVRYGYVWSGSEREYGWMVTSHTFRGLCFDHMTYVGGGAALAGMLCPQGALRDAIADVSPLAQVAGTG
jgi:hypothetical protein